LFEFTKKRLGVNLNILIYLVVFVWGIGRGQTPAEYTVVRVVGKVESQTLKRELKTNDRIQAKDQLKFDRKESYIYVTSPQTGRKKISGVPDSAPREFLQLLESFVRPEYKSTSTRSISLQYLESLQNSLAFDTLLILDDGFIAINTGKLSLKPPAAIKAWYSLNKKVVYRVISKENGLELNKSSLFESPTLPYPKVMVEYFEDANADPVFNPGILLAAFVPLYVNEESLMAEVKVLIGSATAKSYSPLFLEIKNYLSSEYASTQDDILKAWLKKNNLLVE
jgi:hypothetical protein